MNGLSLEKQVEVLLKAERLGPAANDDADWLVAQAASEAAERIASATSDAVRRIEAASPQTGIAAQLDRLESRLKKTAPVQSPPILSGPIRDLVVVAITVCAMILVAVLWGVAAAPVTMLFAAFALGVAITLAYLYFAPIVGRRR